ncbi:MAG: PD40 domain-containing protein [Armatimonadota bacterium]|nr:MAG: PD40 domain-containing protein [Armatimonadota bacterium]
MYIPTARMLLRRALMAVPVSALVVLVAGSPAHPGAVGLNWSSSGRLLAFWSDSGLYAVNTVQGGVIRLSANGAQGFCSPDGLKVAWADRDGTFVYRMDTKAAVRVAEPGRVKEWSPDSEWVLLEASPSGQAWEIYAAHADGKGAAPLAAHPATDRDATWSPDGRWIAFVSDRDGARSDIWVVGGNRSQLTRVTSMFAAGEPAWSPDASKLAFVGQLTASASRLIYSLDFKTNKLTELTSVTDGDCRAPKFLSNGVLRYTSRQDMVVELATGRKRKLPRGELSPDATMVAALSGRPGALDIVKLHDGSRLSLAKGVEACAWSADGRLLAYLALTTGPGSGLMRELRIAAPGTEGVYVLWSEGLRRPTG